MNEPNKNSDDFDKVKQFVYGDSNPNAQTIPSVSDNIEKLNLNAYQFWKATSSIIASVPMLRNFSQSEKIKFLNKSAQISSALRSSGGGQDMYDFAATIAARVFNLQAQDKNGVLNNIGATLNRVVDNINKANAKLHDRPDSEKIGMLMAKHSGYSMQDINAMSPERLAEFSQPIQNIASTEPEAIKGTTNIEKTNFKLAQPIQNIASTEPEAIKGTTNIASAESIKGNVNIEKNNAFLESLKDKTTFNAEFSKLIRSNSEYTLANLNSNVKTRVARDVELQKRGQVSNTKLEIDNAERSLLQGDLTKAKFGLSKYAAALELTKPINTNSSLSDHNRITPDEKLLGSSLINAVNFNDSRVLDTVAKKLDADKTILQQGPQELTATPTMNNTSGTLNSNNVGGTLNFNNAGGTLNSNNVGSALASDSQVQLVFGEDVVNGIAKIIMKTLQR